MKQLNSELLLRIRKYLEENPNKDFNEVLFDIGIAQGQLLTIKNLKIIDYDESSFDTLYRVNKKLGIINIDYGPNGNNGNIAKLKNKTN